MDRAKYRGLRTDGKGWVYGNFIHNSIDCPCIIDNDAEKYEVTPKTVGQHTGFVAEKCMTNLDKDIYEGDVFRSTSPLDEGDVYTYSVVVWVTQRGAFYMIPAGCYDDFINNDLSDDEDFAWLFEEALFYDFSIDVGLTKVGNIHEGWIHERKEVKK